MFLRRRLSRCLQNLICGISAAERNVCLWPEYPLRVYSHQRRTFSSAAEILLRIYQNPIHLNGALWWTTFFRRRTSHCLQNLVRQRVPFKCMGFGYSRSRISAAEKACVFGLNSPLEINTHEIRTHPRSIRANFAFPYPISKTRHNEF